MLDYKIRTDEERKELNELFDLKYICLAILS